MRAEHALSTSDVLLSSSFVLLVGPLTECHEVRSRLSTLPFRIEFAHAENLLQTVATMQPDLVLLDAALPDEAASMCKAVMSEHPDVSIIAVAVKAGVPDKLKLLESGCVDFIVLSEQADEIVARIHAQLKLLARQKQLRRQIEELREHQDNLEKQTQFRTAILSRNNYQLRKEIGERVLIEAELRARAEQFRTLAENASDIIVRHDRECRRIYVNPAYEKITNLRAADVLGKTPTEVSKLVPQGQAYQAVLEKVIFTGINGEAIFDWENEQGKRIVYQTRVVPEFDRHGKVVSVLAIGRNISALKEAERHLEESRAQLQELVTHREAMREEERKQIARELHDELGQLLTTLRMRTRLLQPEFIGNNEELLGQRIISMLAIIDTAVEVVRNVVSNLRPGILDLDIASALQWLGHEFTRNHGITCEVDVPEAKSRLDDERSVALFRIVQESLTNIAKHANATRVDVVFRQQDDLLLLEIQDDGQGFDPVQSARKKTYGLLGIKERVEMLRGRVFIDSALGRGVMLRVEIPAKPNNEQGETS